MSAPLYFLPGVYRQHLIQGDRFSRTVLAGRGLEAIFGDVEHVPSEATVAEISGGGPGGTGGTLLVPLVPGSPPPVRLGYYPQFQDWTNHGDQFWLGIDRESPPGPEDLRRTKQIGGYRMALGDGRDWLVPILRRPNGTSEFPSSFGWDAAGVFSSVVRPAYRQLWEDAGELVELFLANKLREAAKVDLPRLVDWCVRVLAVNYRFDRVMQSALGVIGSDDWMTILAYAIDGPTYLELRGEAQKKTASAEPPTSASSPVGEPATTSPGSEASATITNPATASSRP
jgi:hypothetical protein